MTRFDDRVKAALDADDEAFLRELDAQRGLFGQIGDTMKGPLGGWATLIFLMTFPLAALMFFAVWNMFQAAGMRELVLWTAGALAALLALGFVKQWFFERMNFIALLRELKRLELRLARIEDR
ncbi:DUF6768 family protein [Sphingosinicella terrae]|jgi:hypothetical protein|uniref:DUF6768 family protein n=1 Tax=Sphingosinicella terrae TaxID=2172047 RepID=UPI000E0CE696|nr:DUF6768 family protein [Sphingosinicella terrae]